MQVSIDYFQVRRQEIFDEVRRIYAAVQLERELMQNFAVDEPTHLKFLEHTVTELNTAMTSIRQVMR